MATNACLDELRRRGRRPVPTDAAALAERPLSQLATPDPAAAIEQVVERDYVDQALVQLPEEFRLPVVLRDIAGFDYGAIAEMLDIPPGTVRSRIARGRRRLASILGATTEQENSDVDGNQQAVSRRPTGDGPKAKPHLQQPGPTAR